MSSGSTVVVKWNPVKGARKYDVEMAASASFDRPILDVTTTNTTATPTESVPTGRIYWRVRAAFAKGVSAWSTATFTRAQSPGPALSSPEDGAVLEQPQDPPVLIWQPQAGAEGYLVEVDNVESADDQPDWVDSEIIQTETTSTVVNEPQPNGIYYWRVRAKLDNDIYSRPSASRSYEVGPLPKIRLNRTEPLLEEVVLSWAPVPGAVAYDIRVSTDNGFNNIVDQRTVSGTSYSPLRTYDNASYWWQVRPVNALSQSEEWPEYPSADPATNARTGVFRRVWQQNPDATDDTQRAEAIKPALIHPVAGASEGSSPDSDLYFRWAPVRLASHYIFDLSRDPGFPNTRTFPTQSCVTNQVTYTSRRLTSSVSPRAAECQPSSNGTWYWRVRAVDSQRKTVSTTTAINSAFSEVRSFTWTAPTTTSGTGTGRAPDTQLLLDGGDVPCTTVLPPSLNDPITESDVCTDVSSTPTFDWSPVDGAAYYRLYLARDREFTNMVEGYGDAGDPSTLPTTADTSWNPLIALPDTQAGEAYFWYVRACNSAGSCGLNPDAATNAFRKKSEKVEIAPIETVADQVTFTWTDYRTTNANAVYRPSVGATLHPSQSALAYRVQVSTTGVFSRTDIIDEQVVDQTTYTAFTSTYPEGPLWWRVQAIDGAENGLTWSDIDAFTKRSAAPVLRSPADGTVVSGVAPFRWQPKTFSKLYDLEVYRNEDRTASPGNLAGSAKNIRQTAFTFTKPLQALGTNFVWRVRRTDFGDNKGAWSAWGTFRVDAAVPTLAAPKVNAVVPRRGALFVWQAVASAASYEVQWTDGRKSFRQRTPLTAFSTRLELAKGSWKWRVLTYDSEKKVLRSSSWRPFKVR